MSVYEVHQVFGVLVMLEFELKYVGYTLINDVMHFIISTKK